jgi:hypothetical protein
VWHLDLLCRVFQQTLTNSLLDDLDRSTRGATAGNENTQLPPDTRGSDATKLAVMSIPFEVVA